ncbi:SMC family ATPase [Ktedonosporobacter rubrisoli]|uniref:Nuclease SbcCD subunit C n=1 Tax=Ktedonosporobacter rubrisoli TaxID=2509675 RepID=A0A4P6JWQ5_KTERU|nr:SMC family ATPase [Ktedonosporobacter rubrisoli]QBD80024.1 SMC family ATPase [Ktedonosporobacter rubrisoli]
MLITRIELENIKSYRHIAVDLRRGTTAISGPNGVGKTTLVEAIGFALFGYLPYSQDQFVREGEKHGKVVIRLIGGDDRPYTVERRCGSGARWLIHDHEANARIEQNADVLDKLHELFGIDRERPLNSLFRDALGVPQGTFTSIFLEVGSKRKQTFDALLQIEDYKTAADNLLDTQKYYKEQMQEQQIEINRLAYETRELEVWQQELRDARLQDEQQKEQNVEWTRQLALYGEQQATLLIKRDQLRELEQRYTYSQQLSTDHQARLQEYGQQLQNARQARQIVDTARADYQRYREAEQILQRLRQDEQQRNSLQQQLARLENNLTRTQTNADNWSARLADVAAARQKVVELAPLVEQQIELEKQRDEAMQKRTRYAEIGALRQRLQQQLSTYQRRRADFQQKIKAIEPLVPAAELLHERSERLTQLRIQHSEYNGKRRQLQEKRTLLQEKRLEFEERAERLRRAEHNVAVIEEHRQEAEEMPELQQSYEDLAAQKHRLEGNIEGYTRSRAQSAGGQCPLLNEACLNIRQRGMSSLESYFEGLLKEEHVHMTELNEKQLAVTTRMGQIRKYAEALNKLDQYAERRDTLAEQVQHYKRELERLEHDVETLTQELQTLRTIEQQVKEAEKAYQESKQASEQTRILEGLYKQAQQIDEQIRQTETELSERGQEAEQLRGSETQFQQIDAALKDLNDPRSESKSQLSVIAQENFYQQRMREEQKQLQETRQQLLTLQEQLSAYATLDGDIQRQEQFRQQCQEGHQHYLQNENEARQLPVRQQTYQQQAQTCKQAEQALREVEQAYQRAREGFKEEELNVLSQHIEDLRDRLSALAQDMKHHHEKISKLEQQINAAEKLVSALEAARQTYQEFEDLHAMIEQFRKLIKEAAPYVLKAMLKDISAEANRIFGEIMGDHSAQLSWQNDYEIILRRQGSSRTFAQLSGGEQMSAALSVRLALLKKLSTLNIAFFDEPTQNMDELRRMNLAEQIRRVRGFDQLIVISHDDTFEQSLDSLVRLSKDGGETQLHEEEREARVQEQDLWDGRDSQFLMSSAFRP